MGRKRKGRKNCEIKRKGFTHKNKIETENLEKKRNGLKLGGKRKKNIDFE